MHPPSPLKTHLIPPEGLTKLENLVQEHLGPMRQLLGSKSGYRKRYPNHLVLFNANVYLEPRKNTYIKIWYGDLDLTDKKAHLDSLAQKTPYPLYILYEMDGRFGLEEDPLIKRHLLRLDGEIYVNSYWKQYMGIDPHTLKIEV